MSLVSRLFGSSLLPLAACLAVATPSWAADPGKIVVHVDQPGARISPLLFGLMTEEINYSYEGGLYAELIQNRSFKSGGRGGPPRNGQAAAPGTPVQGAPHWFVVNSSGAVGTAALDTADPINTTALTTSLKLNITDVPAGGARRGIRQ